MKKLMLILIVALMLVAGCPKSPQKPIEDMLMKPNEKWVERFGESKQTSLFFNARVLWEAHNSQEQKINDLYKRLSQLEDPNNLEARLKSFDEKIESRVEEEIKYLFGTAERDQK